MDGVVTFLVAVFTVSVIGAFAWGCPQYNVYHKRMAGQAALAEAESSKKILIEQAKAEVEAARLKAESEIERAKGVAEANKIIGNSLKGNESYLRYLWIVGMQAGEKDTIYIPTEASLPVLEAGRFIRPETAPAK